MRRNGVPALGFHALFIAFVLAPLLAVCITAFTPENYLSMPHGDFSLRWFRILLHRADFQRATWLSVWLAAVAATLAMVFATPAALVLARHRFIGREALTALFMSPLTIPHVVLGIALLRYLTQIGVGSTFAGLVVGHLLLVTPFALRLVMVSAAGLDERIHQAAISLGARPLAIFRRVTLPLILPGIVSGWILAFIVSFDEVAMTVFLAVPGTETLPLRMLSHIQDTTDPLVAAMSAILIAGTAVVALVLDRFHGLDRLLGGAGSGAARLDENERPPGIRKGQRPREVTGRFGSTTAVAANVLSLPFRGGHPASGRSQGGRGSSSCRQVASSPCRMTPQEPAS